MSPVVLKYKLKTFSGTVVRFFRELGYGYIRIDMPPREAHVHIRDCYFAADEIQKGDRLQFYLEQTAKGLNAIQVSKIE